MTQPWEWLTGISSGSPSSATTDGTIENLVYSYGSIGNLMTPADTSPGSSIYEWFAYDELLRLTTEQEAATSTGSRTTLTSNTYDNFDNIGVLKSGSLRFRPANNHNRRKRTLRPVH